MLLHYQTRCEKRDKMFGKLAFYCFSLTRLLNSTKHKHLCKILFVNKYQYISNHFMHIRKLFKSVIFSSPKPKTHI